MIVLTNYGSKMKYMLKLTDSQFDKFRELGNRLEYNTIQNSQSWMVFITIRDVSELSCLHEWTQRNDVKIYNDVTFNIM